MKEQEPIPEKEPMKIKELAMMLMIKRQIFKAKRWKERKNKQNQEVDKKDEPIELNPPALTPEAVFPDVNINDGKFKEPNYLKLLNGKWVNDKVGQIFITTTSQKKSSKVLPSTEGDPLFYTPEATANEKITDKTKEEILQTKWEDLNSDEKMLQGQMKRYPDMTLEQAIKGLEMLP